MSRPRRRVVWGVLALLLVLLLLWVVDYRVNQLRPEVIRTLDERYGLRCEMASLVFAIPNGVRARGVRLLRDDGTPWLTAASFTARFDLLDYLLTGRLSRNTLSSIAARDLELTLRRLPDGEWDLPRLKKPAKSHVKSDDAAAGHRLAFSATRFTVTLVTERGSSSHAYRSLAAEIDPRDRTGVLEVFGDQQRLSVRYDKQPSKRLVIEADSFCLAPLAPLANDMVDLGEVFVDGRGELRMDSGARRRLDATGSVSGLGIRHALLSRDATATIGLGFDIEASQDGARTQLDRLVLSLGGESVVIRGSCVRKEKPVIDLSVTFPGFSLGKAAAAIPPTLRPNLPDLALEGRITGTFSFAIDLARPETLKYDFQGTVDTVRVLALGPKVNVPALKQPFLYTTHLPDNTPVTIWVGPDNPKFTPYSEVPKHLIGAILTAEDGMFFSHHGFSPRHIRDATVENLRAGRVVRGASTLTMQLAKNLFLSRERTFGRKIEEAIITLALEQDLSKQRMMEIYLNVIEWGKGLYGVGPAARFYFNKAPSELSPVESAFLASIIARPRHNWQPDPLAKITENWWSYLYVILGKMYQRHDITIADLKEAGVPDTRIIQIAGDTALTDLPLLPPEEAAAPPPVPQVD